MSTKTFRVKEVARLAGVTVRTLHHYDEIGLLQPSGRTESGHRLYDESQLRRLQQIASLRHLGLSLDDVRACLERWTLQSRSSRGRAWSGFREHASLR